MGPGCSGGRQGLEPTVCRIHTPESWQPLNSRGIRAFNELIYRLVVVLQDEYDAADLLQKIPCAGEIYGEAGGRELFPLYHPAAAMYNHTLKATLFEDARALGDRLRA